MRRTTNQPGNQFRQSIPGLKVAYGSAGNRFAFVSEAETPTEFEPPKSWFARLKESIINLVTEEATASTNDRPIGISQLSRTTFSASGQALEYAPARSIVRSGSSVQDYRFNQLIEPNRR